MYLDDIEENITQYCRSEEGEQIDDLQCAGLRILQKKGTFRYGTDAVLLANYAAKAIKSSVRLLKKLRSPGKTESTGAVRVVDVGTGTGVIPVLMYGKLNAEEGIDPEGAIYTAVEIQGEMCDLARRSVTLNGIGDVVSVLNADICDGCLKAGAYDIVTMNPPYVRAGSGIVSDISGIAGARHEIARTQEEMIRAACTLLVPGGYIFMVNRPDRLTDALCALREAGCEAGELTFVHANVEKPPVMFLLTARKGGGKGLRVTAPTVIGENN